MAGLDVKVSQLGEVVVASDNDLLNLVTYDEQNQTYVSGKVKASTMKDYMIGDTDISDLGDGTPTGAIDVLDGKIDDNHDEWKEQWKKNGAYNICPNNATTQVVGETTFTVNSDKTILVDSNGTAITSQRAIRLDGADALNLKAGTYVICGIPEGVSGEIYINDSTNTVNIVSTTTHAPKVFTVNSDYNNVIIGLVIKPNQPAISSKVFKSMITTDLNATYDDYVPHAKTNRELTEDVTPKQVRHETLNDTNFGGDIYVHQVGRIVYVEGDIQIKTAVTYNTTVISSVPQALSTACGMCVGGDGSYKGRLGISGTNLIASSNLTAGYAHIAMSYLAK